MKFTERDESLPHQIGIRLVDKKIRVTCNCLTKYQFGSKAWRSKKYMPGEPKDYEEARAIYNNPENHDPDSEAFRTPIPGRTPEREKVRTTP